MLGSCLFKLNKFILVRFLLEWLDIRDLTNLDSSLSRGDRRQLADFRVEFREKFYSIYAPYLSELRLSKGLIIVAHERGLPLSHKGVVCDSFLLELRNKSFFNKFRTPMIKICNIVAEYLRNLKTLHLYACHRKLIPILTTVIQHCPNVEDVLVANYWCIDDILSAIGKSCPNLTRLSAVGKLGDVRLSTMQMVLSRCPNLQEMKLDNTRCGLHGKHLCTLMKSLLVNYRQLTSVSVLGVLWNWSFPLAGQLKHLTSLTCDCFHGESFYYFLVHEGGTELTNLDIGQCGSISADCATLIGSHCPKLVRLRVALYSLNEAIFSEFASHLSGLKSFHLVNKSNFPPPCGYIGDKLGLHCPLIESLSICQCSARFVCDYPYLTDLTLEDVVATNLFMEVMKVIGPRLRSLAIHGLTPYNHTNPPKDVVCFAIADNCLNLSALQLQNWYNLPETPYYLATDLQHLEELGLRVYDEGAVVVRFLASCPQIRKLHISCAVSMPVQEWTEVIALCGNMREFHLLLRESLSGSKLMNPDIVRKLLIQCKRLRVFKSNWRSWNVWNVSKFEQELVQLKPDCSISLFQDEAQERMRR